MGSREDVSWGALITLLLVAGFLLVYFIGFDVGQDSTCRQLLNNEYARYVGRPEICGVQP